MIATPPEVPLLRLPTPTDVPIARPVRDPPVCYGPPAVKTRAEQPAPSGDAALVDRLLQGDEAAFAALVDRLGPPMLRLCQSLLGDAHAAEEVVQETWAAALDGLAGFERRSSLKTWLFRILVNRARTRRARDARSVPMSSLGPDDDDEAPSVDPSRFSAGGHWTDPPTRWERDTPEQITLRSESLQVLQDALALLPERQRAVVTLRDVEGFSPEEVCAALDITEGNQRVLLHRARGKLRSAIERHLKGRR